MSTTAKEKRPEQTISFRIHDLARLMRKHFDRKVADLGLTRAQWSVLFHLSRQEGVNQKTLASTLEIEPITLTRILDRMERDGWLERRRDENDRRAFRLYLTDQAWPTLKELQKRAIQTREESLVGVSEADRQAFMRVVDKMKANLHEITPSCETK